MISARTLATGRLYGIGSCLLGLLLCPSPLSGQTPNALDSIDGYIREEMARWRIPGLSVAVLRGDTVLLSRGYGFANLEHHVPATDSTVYETGSVTKQFTAAAIVMLSEQGRLSLDDPITRFLPDGSTTWSDVTIRHLLTHTSGVSDNAITLDLRRDYTEDELVRVAAREPLEFAPGDRESYSSTGYVLLGIIIHRVTGVFYGDFLRDHIFEPLGMHTARVISERDIIPNRAAGYQFVNDRLKNQDWVSPSLLATADGGLLFTVRDLAQWAIALNHGSVLSRTGLEASWTPVRLNDGGTYPYGFGWHIAQQRGHRRIGHSGSYRGFQATIQRYPDFDLTVIVMTNLAQSLPETMAFSIAGILEPKLTPPHRLPGALSEATPPAAIDHLLHEISAGEGSARITPGFRAFLSDTMRERLGRRTSGTDSWTALGCDSIQDRNISRLDARIRWICYARGQGAEPNLLATILYDAAWLAAGIDLYSF